MITYLKLLYITTPFTNSNEMNVKHITNNKLKMTSMVLKIKNVFQHRQCD